MKNYILSFIYLLIVVSNYAQSGAVDTTFGTGGEVITTINNSGMATCVAVQSDGKIIAGGSANFNSGSEFVMVRYTTGGYLDGNFGGIGIISTHIGPSSAANSILVQPDGKIVLAGKSINASGNYDFTLARFNTDGSPDTTFGVEGIEITDLGGDDEITSINIQTDGRLVAAGFSNIDSSSNIALVRYNTDGTMDSTFGRSGMVLTAINLNKANPAPLEKPDCKIQTDGKIVVVSTAFFETNDFITFRYNSDGTPDNSFGNGGEVATDFGAYNDYGYAVYIQPDAKILVAGSSINPATDSCYMTLARYNTDGSLDNTFGISGKVNAIPVLGGNVDARSLALQANGNIVAAGTEISASLSETQEFIVAKYLPDGTLNDSFGTRGYTTTAFAAAGITGSSIALQTDDKIVMAGGNGQDFILTRFLDYADTLGTVDTIPASIIPVGPDIFNGNALIAYPNPTHNNVTLQYNLAGNDNVTIRLGDVLGNVISTVAEDAAKLPGIQTENINMTGLPSGYYMLTLSSSRGQSTIRLLKE